MSTIETADTRPRQDNLVDLWGASLGRVDLEIRTKERRLHDLVEQSGSAESYRSACAPIERHLVELRDQRDVLRGLLAKAGV